MHFFVVSPKHDTSSCRDLLNLRAPFTSSENTVPSSYYIHYSPQHPLVRLVCGAGQQVHDACVHVISKTDTHLFPESNRVHEWLYTVLHYTIYVSVLYSDVNYESM